MNMLVDVVSPSSNSDINLACSSILVGANYQPQGAINFPAAGRDALKNLSHGLKQLNEVFSEIKFSEQIAIDSPQIKEVYRFVTAKEGIVQNFETLISGVDQIASSFAPFESPLLITKTDFEKQSDGIAGVVNRSTEHLEQIKSLFTDLDVFRESADRLNIAKVNSALFIATIAASREQVNVILTSFNRQAEDHIQEIKQFCTSLGENQSTLQITNYDCGQFETIVPPPTASPRSSLIERFTSAVGLIRAPFYNSKEALSKERQEIYEQVAVAKEALHSGILQRISRSFRALFQEGLSTAKWWEGLPFFGKASISRRVTGLKKTLQETEGKITQLKREEKIAIKEQIRTQFGGTHFEYSAEVPNEVILAAIPMHKKDTLISLKTFESRLAALAHEHGGEISSCDWPRIGGTIDIATAYGTSIRLENRDDGKIRIYTKIADDWQKLGSAWSDDALVFAKRFLLNQDFGIVRRGSRKGQWFIPTPSYFENLNDRQSA